MKFYHKPWPSPLPYGATRTSSYFAWWPVRIGDETRWLETVTVKEKYCKDVDWIESSDVLFDAWVKIAFLSL